MVRRHNTRFFINFLHYMCLGDCVLGIDESDTLTPTLFSSKSLSEWYHEKDNFQRPLF